jgi:hypothetical protein
MTTYGRPMDGTSLTGTGVPRTTESFTWFVPSVATSALPHAIDTAAATLQIPNARFSMFLTSQRRPTRPRVFREARHYHRTPPTINNLVVRGAHDVGSISAAPPA